MGSDESALRAWEVIARLLNLRCVVHWNKPPHGPVEYRAISLDNPRIEFNVCRRCAQVVRSSDLWELLPLFKVKSGVSE